MEMHAVQQESRNNSISTTKYENLSFSHAHLFIKRRGRFLVNTIHLLHGSDKTMNAYSPRKNHQRQIVFPWGNNRGGI